MGGGEHKFCWFSWLSDVGMEHYASKFEKNMLGEQDVVHMNHDLLKSMGIHVAKERIKVLDRQTKHLQEKTKRSNSMLKKVVKKIQEHQQASIVRRVERSGVDECKLLDWAKANWLLCDRTRLVEEAYLRPSAPSQRTSILTDDNRTESDQEVLRSTKDILWAVLFGTEKTNVHLTRVARELLCLTVPSYKAYAFNFFRAVTELGASGTWRYPDNVSNDHNASNILLQVEFGETESNLIGDVIMVCTHLINLLEVNEQVLYARCISVEQSTLFTHLYFQRSSYRHKIVCILFSTPNPGIFTGQSSPRASLSARDGGLP